MPHEESQRVLDPEKDSAALKALTHPLRIRLLGMLRQDGPATATELSGRTQESSASTSYHLRVLAKYGFVAEAEHRDGRERRWRAVHAVTSWDNAAVGASPSIGRSSTSRAGRRSSIWSAPSSSTRRIWQPHGWARSGLSRPGSPISSCA